MNPLCRVALCAFVLSGFVLIQELRAEPADSAETVTLLPGDDIQTAVFVHPLGTKFLLKAGTYRGQSITPKDGNVFEGQGEVILDGENQVETAFGGDANNVTIRGLTIQNYRPDTQLAAVDSEGGEGWLIENNTIKNSHNIGVNAGTNTRVIGNKLLDNGMAGFDGGVSGWLFENNEIAGNNARHLDWGFEGGGGKVTVSTSGTFRGNKVWGNDGPGIWLDGNANNIVIEGNEVWDNRGPGIMVEISRNAIVRNNKLHGNGSERVWIHAQIVISSAKENKVYGNRIEAEPGHNGIFVNSQGREYDSVENEIYENEMWLRGDETNTTGMDVDDDSRTLTSTKFHDNKYHVESLATKYFSLGAKDLTLSGMQRHGQELGSTVAPIGSSTGNR